MDLDSYWVSSNRSIRSCLKKMTSSGPESCHPTVLFHNPSALVQYCSNSKPSLIESILCAVHYVKLCSLFSFYCISVSNFSLHQNHMEGLLKHRLMDPTPRVCDSVGLMWDLRIFISNYFPENADASGLRSTL